MVSLELEGTSVKVIHETVTEGLAWARGDDYLLAAHEKLYARQVWYTQSRLFEILRRARVILLRALFSRIDRSCVRK